MKRIIGSIICITLLVLFVNIANAAGPSHYVFALSGAKGAVTVIDTRTDEVIKTFETGKGTTLGCLTPDGKKLYTSENAGTRVHIFDAVNLKKIKTIKTGDGPKHPLVSPDGKYVAINHWGKEVKVVILDAKTDKVIFEKTFPQENRSYKGKRMMHSAWSWDSKYLFVQNFPDKVSYVLEAPTFKVIKTFKHDSETHYFVPTHDNREVWVVNQGDNKKHIPPNVDVIDMKTWEIKKHIVIPVLADEVIEGHHGAFTLDGSWFIYCNRGPSPEFGGHTCSAINPKTYRVETILNLVNGVGHPYFSPEGRYIFMTGYGDNKLPIVDAHTLKIVKILTVGQGWHLGHAAFARGKAYVSNTKDSAVYVIDLETLEVIKKIPVAKGPGQVLNTYTNYFEIAGYPPGVSN